jgi:hypothetical protein
VIQQQPVIAQGPVASTGSGTGSGAPERQGTSTAPAPTPAEPRRSNFGAIGAVVLGVPLVGVIVGAVVVVVLGVVVLLVMYGPGTGSPPGTGTEGPSVVVGAKVVSPDSRPDKKTVPTVLHYPDPTGAEIEITGPGDFRAMWDGKGPFDLGPAGDGAYTTKVSPPGQPAFRLKKFTVDGEKANCDFTFDLNAGEWTGGCK